MTDGCVWVQIYDQIYQENFERARKEEEDRARAAAMREQQAAWGGTPPGGPPGLQNPGWGANPAGNGWQGVHSLQLASPHNSSHVLLLKYPDWWHHTGRCNRYPIGREEGTRSHLILAWARVCPPGHHMAHTK